MSAVIPAGHLHPSSSRTFASASSSPTPQPGRHQAIRAKRMIDIIRPRSPYDRPRKVPSGATRSSRSGQALPPGPPRHAQMQESAAAAASPPVPTSWAAVSAAQANAPSAHILTQDTFHNGPSVFQLPSIASLHLPRLIRVTSPPPPHPPTAQSASRAAAAAVTSTRTAATSVRFEEDMEVDDCRRDIGEYSSRYAYDHDDKENSHVAAASTHVVGPFAPRILAATTTMLVAPTARGRIAPSKEPLPVTQFSARRYLDGKASGKSMGSSQQERYSHKRSFAKSSSPTHAAITKDGGKVAYIPGRLPRPRVGSIARDVVEIAVRSVVAASPSLSTAEGSSNALLEQLHAVSPLLFACSELYVPAPPPPQSPSTSSAPGMIAMPLRLRSDVRPGMIQERRAKLERAHLASSASGAPTHCLMVMPSRPAPIRQGPPSDKKAKASSRNQDEVGRMMLIQHSVFAAHCAFFPALSADRQEADEGESTSTRSSSSSSSTSSSLSPKSTSSDSTATSQDQAVHDLLPSSVSVPLLSISVPSPSTMPLLAACLHEPIAAKVLGRLLDVQSLAGSKKTGTDALSTPPRRRAASDMPDAAEQESDSDATPRKSSAKNHARPSLAPPVAPESPENAHPPVKPSIPNSVLASLSRLRPREIHAKLSLIHRTWSCAVALGVSDEQIWLGLSRAWEICAGLLAKQMQPKPQPATEIVSGFKRVVSFAGPGSP